MFFVPFFILYKMNFLFKINEYKEFEINNEPKKKQWYVNTIMKRYEIESNYTGLLNEIDFICIELCDKCRTFLLKENTVTGEIIEKYQDILLGFDSIIYKELQIKKMYLKQRIALLETIPTNKPGTIENEQNNPVTKIVTFDYETNEIKGIFFPEYIPEFKNIETKLISENYFNEVGKWIKHKDPDLIAFIKFLIEYIFLRGKLTDKKTRLKIRKFFENRYNVNLEKEFQPNRLAEIKNTDFYCWLRKKT